MISHKGSKADRGCNIGGGAGRQPAARQRRRPGQLVRGAAAGSGAVAQGQTRAVCSRRHQRTRTCKKAKVAASTSAAALDDGDDLFGDICAKSDTHGALGIMSGLNLQEYIARQKSR